MKIPDLNLLIYASNSNCEQHAVAVQWFEEQYNAGQNVAFAWVVLLGFIRLSTRHGILEKPLTVEECLANIDTLINHPNASIVQPSSRHFGILGRLLWV